MLPDITMERLNDYGANSLLLKMRKCSVLLDTPELDELIERLSAIRQEILPETPIRPSPNHQYVVETEPVWRTIRNPLFDGLVVFFRHSGFGWTGFAISDHGIPEFIKAMSAFGERPAKIDTVSS
jgi:hypothetical protein